MVGASSSSRVRNNTIGRFAALLAMPMISDVGGGRGAAVDSRITFTAELQICEKDQWKWIFIYSLPQLLGFNRRSRLWLINGPRSWQADMAYNAKYQFYFGIFSVSRFRSLPRSAISHFTPEYPSGQTQITAASPICLDCGENSHRGKDRKEAKNEINIGNVRLCALFPLFLDILLPKWSMSLRCMCVMMGFNRRAFG